MIGLVGHGSSLGGARENVGGTHTVSIQHLYQNINKRIVHTTVVELLTSQS